VITTGEAAGHCLLSRLTPGFGQICSCCSWCDLFTVCTCCTRGSC